RDEAERRMSEEIEFHLEMETRRYIQLGLTQEEARRRALVAFGGVERHKEELRHGRGIPLLEELWRDLHYAVRALRKSPAFTIAAVLTLALGVGANTAVFGLVSASLLRPLPFPDAQRLVALSLRSGEAAAEGRSSRWSYPEFAAVRSSAVSFSHLAAYFADDVNLSAGNAAPERVRAEMVSASYFPSLGVQAAVGRTFMMEEDSIPGMHPVVILSSELWTRALGADPQAIGSRVVLNGRSEEHTSELQSRENLVCRL